MRVLTLITMRCPEWSGMVGVEYIGMNFGDDLHKGTTKFSQLGPPLDALILPDDQQSDALLPDKLLELGMVGIVGYPENSGEPTSAC
jgi:hypothetical protein